MSKRAKSTKFFQTKGEWGGLPIILQGIIEDGTCIAIKVKDATNNQPISWAFSENTRRDFTKLIQRLYDEQKDSENNTAPPTGPELNSVL